MGPDKIALVVLAMAIVTLVIFKSIGKAPPSPSAPPSSNADPWRLRRWRETRSNRWRYEFTLQNGEMWIGSVTVWCRYPDGAGTHEVFGGVECYDFIARMLRYTARIDWKEPTIMALQEKEGDHENEG